MDDTMTVKEIATVLNVDIRTVQRAVKRFFSSKISKGKTTRLNEVEVTIIKKEIERHHNCIDKRLNTGSLVAFINFVRGEQ